ncbi:Glycosyl hydrolases family 18 [Tenacibaculum sp. MAR_2009_124]|uniref:glycosyl hydrolase family 18 protein n=1 Tax=Tenacibaculum sp. MAR_2009_124 TaxID=1250059 RepID=UPI0008985555|nr:glycosyl hydrolase family 18 protein [Tenacibaculum sp. MAR_2009_124]SEB84323.1 Glycosyl hydrolases family 18 [Tenacibaculum sp. MAR_2009_124]
MKNNILYAVFLVLIIASCSKTKPNKPFESHRSSQEKLHQKFNFTKESQWDSLKKRTSLTIKYKNQKRNPRYKTFGWHLYSSGTAYTAYNFDILWGISYFSYSVNPENGDYKSIHQWKTTALIDSAKAHNCKVFLSISNFGASNNMEFLKNSSAQENLIQNVIDLLDFRNADGINIDFEEVSSNSKSEFNDFIVKISEKLKLKNPKYMVSLCLYAEDWHDVFDIPKINNSIDFYTLMAYDYYGSFSKVAGPVSPLKTSKEFGNGMEYSVNYYLSKGVKPDKLIVGVPYYGAEWLTTTKTIPSKVSKFIANPPYRIIKSNYIDGLNAPIQFNTNSESTYITLNENSAYKELWFEDVKSLSLKYNWIKEKQLAGAGIWALGYDHGYPELWNLLKEKFTE